MTPSAPIRLYETIACRKSEGELSSPYEKSYLSATVRPRPPSPTLLMRRKGAKNFCARKGPHKPLKSLDSDERIQVNPRESNSQNLKSWRRNRHAPRKPKRGSSRAAGVNPQGLLAIKIG